MLDLKDPGARRGAILAVVFAAVMIPLRTITPRR